MGGAAARRGGGQSESGQKKTGGCVEARQVGRLSQRDPARNAVRKVEGRKSFAIVCRLLHLGADGGWVQVREPPQQLCERLAIEELRANSALGSAER